MKKRILTTEHNSDGFNTGSLNWLLHARYVRGEHALCLELAEDLQKKHENKHRYAHYIKGSVLAEAGRLQEALERYHSCIRLYPQDPEPLKQVAKCLSRQHRFQLSREAYLEADKLTKHPDPDIYCALAECSWHLGEPERGVEWARSAVQAGGVERAGALLAKLLLACDDVHGALAAYDQALTAHACSADTLASAGALRLRNGDPRRAFQLLGAALAQQPTQHAAALALAAMMLQHKDLDAALARLKVALAAHPTCVAAHANLGMALLAKKKYIAALTCLQRACWSAPLSARAAHDLGLALLVCKRPASAFCRLATAAALQPFQPYTTIATTSIMAALKAILSNISGVNLYLELAVASSLSTPQKVLLTTINQFLDGVLLIGIALERLGDSRSDAAYSRAASLAADDPLIRLNLAGRHARAGRLGDAGDEAKVTAELLHKEEKPDAQLASFLSILLSSLRDAGVELSRLPALPEAETESPASQEPTDANEDKFAPDEV